MKKRILFCGESSWLSTGFATYNREIISRLYATGKYEIAEYGAYGRPDDVRAKSLPWRFYGVLPMTKEEEQVYHSKPTNQFGEYKFDAAIADFQPDIVFDARDPWMFMHMFKSRFRNLFRAFIVPTVDSAPQKKEWVDQLFRHADAIATYSKYGKRVLEAERLKVNAVLSPGVNLDVFQPMDKKEIKEKWGIRPKTLVIGTVMRNQKRKLFPDLFEAYATLRTKYKSIDEIERSVLLCHTSWPDVGWDIPELLERHGILRHVIFTYKCSSCAKIFHSWFLPCDSNGSGRCIFCGKQTAKMPSTHQGVSDAELAEIYNLMDIYVQPAICEGWGLPIVEAKSCGIPGLYSNYSAMEDHIENGGGLPIEIGRFYTESETMAVRTLTDLEDFVEKMKLLLTNKALRISMGKKARLICEQLHNWNDTCKALETIIDSIPLLDRRLTWNSRPNIKLIENRLPPPEVSNEQFVLFCYQAILGRQPDESGFNHWLTKLASGTKREDVAAFFRSETDAHNKFESVRYMKSLENRGVTNAGPIELPSSRLPSLII